MKKVNVLVISMLVVFAGAVQADQKTDLEAACEKARMSKLIPIRKDKISACIAKGDKSKEECVQEWSYYGERAGNRAALYYDLPECVKASDYTKGTNRRTD